MKLPAHLGHPEFIEVAAIDEDMILVEEDAPDYAAGERDVPTEGVDDKTAAQVQLADEPPAEAFRFDFQECFFPEEISCIEFHRPPEPGF